MSLLVLVDQSGIQLTEGTYAYLMHCYNAMSNYSKVVATLKEMKSKGMVPKVRCYHQALAATAEQHDITTALSLFHAMRENNVEVS